MTRADLARGYEAYRELVNRQIAVRAELLDEPWRLARAEGARLVDLEGRAVDDFIAGWGTQAFGHRPRAVEDAVRRFLDGDAPSFYPSSVSPWAGLVAERLRERTGYDSVWFGNAGTEAVEAAIKMARAATGKPRILCVEGAYHGCTMGSVAMMGAGPHRDPFAPHVGAVEALPFGDVEALVRELAAGDVAAVVVEPIQVESGVRALPAPFIEALCAERRALIVVDEIQTGLGRTGRWLASEAWPRRPDVVTIGKALGGGLLPISAMLTRSEIFARAYGSFERAESHASTFSGNALACVAALAAIDLLTDDLLARVRRAGDRFRAALAGALAGAPLVAEVRGDGLLVGIALARSGADHPWLTFEYLGVDELGARSAAGVYLTHRLFRAGFVTGVCGHDWSTVRLQPPLTINDERLDAFVSACAREVEYLCRLK